MSIASHPFCALCLSIALLTQPLMAWAVTNASMDDDSQTPRRLTSQDNQPETTDQVQLSLAQQTVAGLKTQVLLSSHYLPEVHVSANVLDIQPLLTLREQYFSAQIENQSANTALTFTQQAIARTQELYRNGVNSQRQVQEQQMASGAIQARVSNSHARLQSINDQLMANWGITLSNWAKDPQNSDFARFINGQQALLLISLPAGHSLPKGLSHIDVDPNGERQSPQQAQFIASAPQGSELSQGETYFFKTSRRNLRTGMRLSAWMAKPDKALTGFTIPASALIWHGGEATIFLKTAPEHFTRLLLKQYYPIAQGYFVAEALPANAEVVVTGAQLLLSHAFRALIPAEDGDGDD
ncbi:MAG: hypothetical protein NTV00_11560 [Methylococcales bacterium]|nr:hypothetical protein [Methylococcales bacterium]